MALNILITGSNSGFGLLTAKKFAAAGHTVHATLRNPDKGAELQALREAGLPVTILQLDVTDPASIAKAVEAASRSAPIDALVNNAGFEVRAPVEQLSDAMFHRQFDTNVLGVVRMVRAVAPAMRARGQGRIVNISSVAGVIATPFAGAYSASKHAVEALSESLWYELAPFGVRVVIVEPGAFTTQFGQNIIPDPSFDESSPYAARFQQFQDAMAGFRESGGVQNPQEVADIVFEAVTDPDPKLRYLAGNDARMLAPLYRSMSFEQFATTMIGRLGVTGFPKLRVD
jgi:NAD(P)-dependent dehydrogenase (short-subunit alcohol dehydrogenase family)